MGRQAPGSCCFEGWAQCLPHHQVCKRTLMVQFMETTSVVDLFSEPRSEFLHFMPRPVRGHHGVGSDHSRSQNKCGTKVLPPGPHTSPKPAGLPTAAGPVSVLSLCNHCSVAHERPRKQAHSNSFGAPWACLEGEPRAQQGGPARQQEGHHGNPAPLWNKQRSKVGEPG